MPAASVRAATAAVTFLTRVPVGRAAALDAADVARGSALFPVVGLGVGAAAGGIAAGLEPTLPSLASAGIAIAAAVLITGAMHVDALGDVADAVGGWTRERALEIMRDSRIGSFAASAITLDLLLKVVAVAVLTDKGGVVQAASAAGALSRAAGVSVAAVVPYPRAHGGSGSVLAGRVHPASAGFGVLFAVAVSVVLLGWTGLALTAGAAVTTLVLAFVFRRWLGGATGDCIGACIELAETVALLVAVALV